MRGEPGIRDPDEIFVEPILAHSRFTSANQQNRAPLEIEGEAKPPFAIGKRESQLLHVRVLRAVQRVAMRPPKLRSKLPRQPCQRCDFKLNSSRKRENMLSDA